MKKTNNCLYVEKHIIKPSNHFFDMLMNFCFASKNLYDHANYIIRKEFIDNNKWIRYSELDKLLKSDEEYPDYKNMPTAQSAQQTLKLLDKNWKSFFNSIKDWSKHKDKYLGRPKMPKYLKKNGKYVLVLTNQNCKIKDNIICFPKVFRDFCIKPVFINRKDFKSFQQVRIIPHKNKIVIELIYEIEVTKEESNNGRYIGIDIGVNNLATVCNNIGENAFIINGKPLKSINQFYNKQVSHYREICKRMNNTDFSNRMDKLTEKRNLKIDDYLHKASRKIIKYCTDNQISVIVIGQNKEWKQSSSLSKKLNQHFVQIPFARFIQMIQYKAKEKGIAVILTEESYTSGTSFIDDEMPVNREFNKARRIHRGLFKSNNNILINADLNGAYQILKKVFPIKWDRGCALHPFVV
ncbi:MAG: transposase, partial [Clostridia bacterium]|nr:transposase [Clostridia bacterium]